MSQSRLPKTIFKMNDPRLSGENNPRWSGGIYLLNCKVCFIEYGVPKYRKDVSKYCSNKCQKIGQKTNVPWNKGIKIPDNLKHNYSRAQKKRFKENVIWNKGISRWWDSPTEFKKGDIKISGENHYNWKGGITPIHARIRNSLEYKEWRKMIFKRDSYTCRKCGKIGGELEADHIKPFSLYRELRTELNNGQTLCKSCHKLKTYKDMGIINERRNRVCLLM